MTGMTRTRAFTAFTAVIAAALSVAITVAAPAPVSAAQSPPKGFPSLVAVANARATAADICGQPVCYYYAGARQTGLSATGASVSLTQAQPVVGPNDFHSLAELAVESSDQQQIVEVGWTVAEDVNGDSVPHLFVYHWINGASTCYNACGFVDSPGGAQAGEAVDVGSIGRFKIQFTKARWVVSYNGKKVGYFPESLWGGSFTSVGIVQTFGEVAASSTSLPQTQMGNGILGTSPGSAVIKNFALIGSGLRPSLSFYAIGDETAYNYGKPKPTGLRFGGPGHPSSS